MPASSKIFVRNFGIRGAIASFTLVELLIVIAILAIVAAAIVIILNPVELLAQARDSQRSSDTKTVSDALSLFVVDNPSASLGTYKKVYISLPDPSSDVDATCPTIRANLPTLPPGWTYNCVTSNKLRNTDGTGWVPVDLTLVKGGSPTPSLPIDPTNSSAYFYSYIPSVGIYAISGSMESLKYKQSSQSGLLTTQITQGSAPQLASIPQGGDWVSVPGDSTYGTSDFRVMKYETKCVDLSGGALLSPTESPYETYYDSNAPCTAANNRYISSQKDGYVITRISHNTAKAYCSSIGAHLITNEEWMTIARNIERVSSNWSGGSVGNGYLYSGHNDNVPGTVLQASSDSDGYAGTQNASGNQKRIMALSNGETIWDIAGNAWEHVQRTSADIVTNIDLPPCSDGLAVWGWCEYGNTTTPYISAWTADVAQNYVGPSNTTNYNSSKGMGHIFTYKDGTDQGKTIFIRGGYWGNVSSSGIFALLLSWVATDANRYVGFRCVK